MDFLKQGQSTADKFCLAYLGSDTDRARYFLADLNESLATSGTSVTVLSGRVDYNIVKSNVQARSAHPYPRADFPCAKGLIHQFGSGLPIVAQAVVSVPGGFLRTWT